jgi:hypothetical protein
VQHERIALKPDALRLDCSIPSSASECADQGKPDIKPDRLLDDFGRESMAATANLGHHRWLWLKVINGKPNGEVTMPSGATRHT